MDRARISAASLRGQRMDMSFSSRVKVKGRRGRQARHGRVGQHFVQRPEGRHGPVPGAQADGGQADQFFGRVGDIQDGDAPDFGNAGDVTISSALRGGSSAVRGSSISSTGGAAQQGAAQGHPLLFAAGQGDGPSVQQGSDIQQIDHGLQGGAPSTGPGRKRLPNSRLDRTDMWGKRRPS